MARIVYGTIIDDNTLPLEGVGVRFTIVNRDGQSVAASTIEAVGGVVESSVSVLTDVNGEFSIEVLENALLQGETYYKVEVMPDLAGSVYYTSFISYLAVGGAITLREMANVLPQGTSTIYDGSTIIIVPTGVQPFGDPTSTLARVHGVLLDASANVQPNIKIDFTLVNADFQPITGYLQDEVFALVEKTSTWTDSNGTFEVFIQGNTAVDSETYYKVHIHNSEDTKFVSSITVGDDLTLREFIAQGQAVTGEAKTLDGYIDLARRWAEEEVNVPVYVDDSGIAHFSAMSWAVAAANNATLGIQIDDNIVAPDKVWSSLKTSNELAVNAFTLGSKQLNESNIADGHILHYNAFLDELEYVVPSGGGGGVDYFIQLLDTPSSFTGAGGRIIVVKADETGLEYSTFTDPSLKADKVVGAITNNFAGLDSIGNLIDSGSKASDFLPTGYRDDTKIDTVVGIDDGMLAMWLNDGLASANILFSDVATVAALNGKADKVVGAITNNFAGLDGVGNLIDSSSKASDFATAAHTHSEFDTMMVKTSGVTDGNIGILISNQIQDGGILVSDIAVKSEITGKADKVLGAVAGNVATLDVTGNLIDSGLSPSDFARRLDEVLEYTNVTDITYTVVGKKQLMSYSTGNKVEYVYNTYNNPVTINYYDTDGTTLLFTQSMTYNVASENQLLKTSTWA